jgi:penicillin amidase
MCSRALTWPLYHVLSHLGVARINLTGGAGPVRIERDDAGTPRVWAESLADALLGLGYMHARDRGLQMLLVRIASAGRLSESVRADDASLEMDRFFRRLNFAGDYATEAAALSADAQQLAAAYCQGVNLGFDRHDTPWELRWLGYRAQDQPWTLADTFLTAKAIGYVSLAEIQGMAEQLLVEFVQHGLARDKLEELFPGLLGGLDEALLRQVTVAKPAVPAALRWTSVLARATASNNWVIAGHKSVSGLPLFANDPHLEITRLPPIWYLAALHWKTDAGPRYALGASLPGTPAIIVGRTPDVAWGVTFACADCMDSWIEECRAGSFRRGARWLAFRTRRETIRRKGKSPIELTFHENEHGVLDGDPHVPGLYLATRWSCGEGTSASSIQAALAMFSAASVEEGRRWLGRLNNASWNWVLADRAGSIGYQMSGRVPLRRDGVSGLVPLPGWDAANDWRGFAPPEDLPRALNPPEGFLVTANHDLNALGRVRALNLPMAAYRAERLQALLRGRDRFTVEDMQALQLDLFSPQAERFRAVLQPCLKAAAARGQHNAQILLGWDLRYDTASHGAFLFEQFYRELILEVFGAEENFGPEVMRYLLDETVLFIGFFGNFDRILLSEKSTWFGARSQAALFERAWNRVSRVSPKPYGRHRRVTLEHLMLGGRLPRWLGFDRGPIELPGSRATVNQVQVLRAGRRRTCIAPSLRAVSDLATDALHVSQPGGTSDRRFSPWYDNGTAAWLAGRYRVLQGLP